MNRCAFIFLAWFLTALSSASAGEPVLPIDVYLIGGQSNATGQGYMANLAQDIVPDTRVMLFHSGKPHLNSGAEPNSWLALRQASESPDRFGPELGFGNQIKKLMPDKKIALIKHAHSGSNLYIQWNPAKDAADSTHFGEQYKTFVETVELGLKGLRDMGFTPAIRGMIWQQGESDRTDDAAEKYGVNLAHFIARVREQFHAPNMLFVYGYVLPPPCTGHQRELIRKAEKDIDQNSGAPLALKGAFVVETDDLSQRANDANTKYPTDHVHFGTAGTFELGCRMAEKMASELRGQK